MGSGIIQCWINGPAPGGIDDKIKMAIIILKTNIPAFSPRRKLYPPACRPYGLEAEPEATIPLFHFRGKFGNPKKSLYSQPVVEIPIH